MSLAKNSKSLARDSQGENSPNKGFQQRLQIRMSEMQINQTELVKLSGIGKSSISAYYNGERLPAIELVFTLSKALKVRPEWLILGTGPMLDDELPNVVNGFGEARYLQFQQKAAHGELRALPHNEILPVDLMTWIVKLPLVNLKISGGSSHELEVQDLSYAIDAKIIENLSEHGPDNLVIGYMPTNALIPTIPENAPIIIDQNDRAIREGAFVFRYGDYIQVKKLRPRGKHGIEIISTNPEYPSETLDQDSAKEIQIIGKVVHVIRGV